MFLHEPGDENESFSRQDLSSMNVASTQSPSQIHAQPIQNPQPQPPPPQQPPQSIAAAAPPTERKENKGEQLSQEDAESSALPSSASWATAKTNLSRAQTQTSESTSVPQHPASTASDHAAPESVHSDASRGAQLSENVSSSPAPSQGTRTEPQPRDGRPPSPLTALVRNFIKFRNFEYKFDWNAVDEADRPTVQNMPMLFDPNGAAKRRMVPKQNEEHDLRKKDSQVAQQALSAVDFEEMPESGSLQLGGEPEERNEPGLNGRQRQTAIRPPALDTLASPQLGSDSAFPTRGLNGRMMTPSHDAHGTQQFKSSSPSFLGQTYGSQSGSVQPPSAGGMGHARQGSRYSFANESSASASVKPVANPKLMNQQSSMMPPSHANQYSVSSQHPSAHHLFSSGVQGPPPGLKSTGTPPVSGGGMFGQGHGFATAGLGYNANATNRNANDEMMRDLLRNRGGSTGSGQASSDAGRREYMFPSMFPQSSQSSTPAPNTGHSGFANGPYPGAFQDHGHPKQKKKGKKHRHANTSSSGGGVVDLADPSILQARMQHSGHSGQGIYGPQGQSQGAFNSMMYGNTGFGRW